MEDSKKVEKTNEKTVNNQLLLKQMTLKDKFKYFFSNITIEPIMACYIMPSVLASLATQNLNLEKACRVNLQFNSDVCDKLAVRDTTNYTHEEVAVQQLVTSMTIWKTMLQSSIPAVLMLFIGSWSDAKSCRKPFIILPIFGELLTTIGFILCTYFFYELPMEVNGVVEGLIPALTGGWFTMFMASFSYIAHVTTEEMRTLRIGLVNIFCSLGVPIGMALSGILYLKIGFYGVFSLSASLYVLSIIYGILFLNEPESIHTTSEQTVEIKPVKNVFNFLKEFFDLKHVAETFRVAFKNGENGRRKKVMALMIVVCVVIGPMHGEMAVAYLFARYRFNWNEIDYSIYSTYNVVIYLIGTAVSVGVFSHWLKIDDSMIGVLSCSSKILSSFVYAFAPTPFIFYLGAIVEMLNGTSFIAMRSMASKLVPTDELGKVNSLIGVGEALMPFVYGPMYGAVYSATIDILPGAFYILGGILTLPAFFIFLWFYIDMKKNIPDNVKNAVENGGINNKAYEVEKSDKYNINTIDFRQSNIDNPDLIKIKL